MVKLSDDFVGIILSLDIAMWIIRDSFFPWHMDFGEILGGSRKGTSNQVLTKEEAVLL